MYKEKYINEALKQAKKAYIKNEVPVGAVIVDEKGTIIGVGYNKKEKTKNIYDHAEMIALKQACKKNKDWRLENCSIYITLEPCPMCASAIEQSRIKYVYYGTKRKNKNNTTIIEQIFDNNVFCQCLSNKNCADMLSEFFKKRR